MKDQKFLRISFTNRSFIKKYFRMNFLSSLSDKNDFLNLLYRVSAKLIFHWKAYLLVGRNGTTWDGLEHRTKLKKVKLKTLNFVI